MNLYLKVEQLKKSLIIGILPHEREKKQEVLINLQLKLEDAQAGRGDSIEDTLDYAQVCHQLDLFLAGKKYHLIEELARDLYQKIKENSAVETLQVEIIKPGALEDAKYVSCIYGD